jgi:hypothetical protein
MTKRTYNARPAMLIAALMMIVAAIAFETQSASAQQCCTVNIRNLSSCRFRACFDFGATQYCFGVGLGANNVAVPHCAPHRLVAMDACGNPHHFPTVVGQCITVNTGAGCCLLICMTAPCCWDVIDTHCLPC